MLQFQANPRDFILETVALCQVFLWVLSFYLVSIIPPVLHTYLHLHVALTRRMNGRKLGGNFPESDAHSEIGDYK